MPLIFANLLFKTLNIWQQLMEVIQIDAEQEIDQDADPVLQFSSVEELIYTRIVHFIEIDHEGRHHISPSNINMILGLQADSSKLNKHLVKNNLKNTYVKKNYVLKQIQKIRSKLCSKGRCSRVTMKIKDKKYQRLLHDVWKWIQANEHLALKERIDCFGNHKLSVIVKDRFPEIIDSFLSKFKVEKSLSNFELSKVRAMVEENLKDYNFI